MVPVPSSTTLTNSHARTAAPFPVRWSPSLMKKSPLPTKFNHMSTKPTPSSIHTFCTCVLIAILLQFLYSSPLPPIIGNIPDNTICPIRASLSVLINLLYLPMMADVPSLSALFVPTCTRTAPPVPPPMTCPAFSAISSTFAPGRHTVMSSPLFTILSTFLMMESPINTRAFLAFPCDTTSAKLLSCCTLLVCPLSLISSTFTVYIGRFLLRFHRQNACCHCKRGQIHGWAQTRDFKTYQTDFVIFCSQDGMLQESVVSFGATSKV